MKNTQQRHSSPDGEQRRLLDFSFSAAVNVEKSVFQQLDAKLEEMRIILPHENNRRSWDSVSLSKKSVLSGTEGTPSNTSSLPAGSSTDRGLRCLLSRPMAPSSLPSTGKLERPKETKPKIAQGERWHLHYKEFLAFVEEKGHAHVPHTYPENPKFANWVRRQRRLYKEWLEGKPTAMTDERLNLLALAGFIFDSHELGWRKKLSALNDYRRRTGDCNVSHNYKDKKLAIWVKNQRRDYKLLSQGKPTAMSRERIDELEKIGFEWDVSNFSGKESNRLPISNLLLKHPFQTNHQPRMLLNLQPRMLLNLQPGMPITPQTVIQPSLHPDMKFSMGTYPMVDFSIPYQAYRSIKK